MNGKKTLTYAVFFSSKTKRTQEYPALFFMLFVSFLAFLCSEKD